MEDDTHLIQYRRFFGVLLSVLPGLVGMLGLGFFTIWILADVAEIEWGWAMGVGAIVMVSVLAVWIWLGMSIQRWSEDKPLGTLAGLSSPFLAIILGVMGFLFVEYVLVTHCEETAECASGETCQDGRCR